MPDPIRILVVDDHPAFRFGLIAMLNSRSDFRVIADPFQDLFPLPPGGGEGFHQKPQI